MRSCVNMYLRNVPYKDHMIQAGELYRQTHMQFKSQCTKYIIMFMINRSRAKTSGEFTVIDLVLSQVLSSSCFYHPHKIVIVLNVLPYEGGR